MKNYKVIKRNGKTEDFIFDKILTHIDYATKGLNVDKNDLIANFKIRMTETMNTTDIQKSLIYSSADLISISQSDWQYATARLVLQDLYKTVYGSFNPKFGYDELVDRINKGFYSKDILDMYEKEEIEKYLSYIDFEKDKQFTYLGIHHMTKKYLIKSNGKPIETPQEIFMLIPMYIFGKLRNKRKKDHYIKKFYKALSNFDIFLSTPVASGIRTNLKGWTSCALLNWGDSIESFGNASKSTFKLITKLRAGIGADFGYIRGMGADINNGFEKHTGIVGYLKVNEAITGSSQQPSNGRTGASANYYPFFHWEIENILQLKNNKGSDENSVRHSDHTIIFNKLFYERYLNDEDITLFHMNEVEDLYDLIGDDEAFKELYEKLERKHSISKRKIKASQIYDRYLDERYSTSRIYKVNANDFDRHSAFNLPLHQSNLCTEISLPSYPDEDHKIYVKSKKEFHDFIQRMYKEGKWYAIYKYIYFDKIIDEDVINEYKSHLDKNGKLYKLNFGEIASCILGGINFGNLPKDTEKRRKFLKNNMDLLVRFLDLMIDLQDYADIEPFEKFTKKRRALGISPGNLFYLLAQYGYDYNTKEARELVNDVMEEMLYYGLKASNEIAKDVSPCEYFADTKYSKGILPIDTYNKNVDKLVSSELHLNWEELREEIKKYGLRNSTILTAVPSSNSSRPANMISGINPPQAVSYVEEDNTIKIQTLLPDVDKYKEFYERNLSWGIDVIEYWKLIAVFQKFIDQSISLNEYVDFTKYPDKQIPKSEVLKRDFFSVIYGLKTLYYNKTKTDDSDESLEVVSEEQTGCSGGGCTL